MKLERRRVNEFTDAITVGVTGTYYNSPDVRFEQALATAEGWRYEGLPLVVVDGSPDNEKGKQWVEAALKARGAWVLAQPSTVSHHSASRAPNLHWYTARVVF